MPRKKGVPYARDDQLKKRHGFTLTDKAFAGLSRLLNGLGFKSISELWEAVGRGEAFVVKTPPTIEDAIAVWDLAELADAASIPIERLLDIQNGGEPNPDELVGLAWALKMKPSELHKLLSRGCNGKHECSGR